MIPLTLYEDEEPPWPKPIAFLWGIAITMWLVGVPYALFHVT